MRQSEGCAPADVLIGRVDRQARIDQRDTTDKIEPALAAEPIEKTEASEAAENADAREPTDPTDKIEPAEPTDRIEPEEPIDRIDPLDPMLKMEPEDLGERDEPTVTCIRTFWQQAGPGPAFPSRPPLPKRTQPADHMFGQRQMRAFTSVRAMQKHTAWLLGLGRIANGLANSAITAPGCYVSCGISAIAAAHIVVIHCPRWARTAA
jgi:hypothetical protein